MKKYYKTIQVDGKQVRLHRHLMEQKIGRKLLTTELVHHINHNMYDNRIENLEIVTRSEHKKKHPEIGLSYQFKQQYEFDKEKIIEMRKKMTIQQIADNYKCVIGTIYHYMKKNNLINKK